MSVPLVTAGRDSAGELSESSARYPDYGSAMTLYNTYDSIIRGAVSVVAPNEATEAEEEQEESSDYSVPSVRSLRTRPVPELPDPQGHSEAFFCNQKSIFGSNKI